MLVIFNIEDCYVANKSFLYTIQPDLIYIVCNTFYLNFSSIYILTFIWTYYVILIGFLVLT